MCSPPRSCGRCICGFDQPHVFAAAYQRDTLEDTLTTLFEIVSAFGIEFAELWSIAIGFGARHSQIPQADVSLAAIPRSPLSKVHQARRSRG